jgi:ATP-dependent DNA ligase
LEPPWSGLHLSIPDDCRGGSQLAEDKALIDGEAVVLRKDGRSDFRALLTKRGGAQASLKT